jgi:Flp pilus assembly protein TadD
VSELKDNEKVDDLAEVTRLVEIGLYAAHTGQVAKARALFEGLLKAKPKLSSAKLGLALSYLVVNEFEKAEEGFKEVLAIDPNHNEAQALLGLSMLLSGRVEEARPVLTKATEGPAPGAELARFLLDN